MKRGQIFVRAVDESGQFGRADVLDLDEESFRAFVCEKMLDAQLVIGLPSNVVPGHEIALRTKRGVHVTKAT